MSERQKRLLQWIAEENPEALLAVGFEEAILGMAERCSQPSLVVYDTKQCLEILIERDGMDPSEALEFLQFNTLGAWMGAGTPLFLWRWEDGE